MDLGQIDHLQCLRSTEFDHSDTTHEMLLQLLRQ